jgi:hypothetical protein
MNLMRKSVILIILLIIFNLLIVGLVPAFNIIGKSCLSPLLIDEILDQKQELHNREKSIRRNILIAQEFKPSKTPLTKVCLKFRKTLVIQEPLIVSIRKELDQSDLTFASILGSQIPFNTFWVEFDFADIEVDVEETYYIVVRSTASQSFWWQIIANNTDQGDPYERGKLWQSNNNGIIWEFLDDVTYFFDCTFKTYTYDSKPDLQCTGTLSWINVTPNDEVTGLLTVENIGTPLSYLNWEIYSWPSWGIWTFSTKEGVDLKPEDGPLTIQITIDTPNITNSDYSGRLKIINTDDEDDFCIIYCTLSTSKLKQKILINLQLDTFYKNIFQLFKKLNMYFI